MSTVTPEARSRFGPGSSRGRNCGAFFAAREGQGCSAPDPIFIVGLPRSGSTLVEQILASHSLVEGTRELPDVPGFALELGALEMPGAPANYPQSVANLDRAQLRALGLSLGAVKHRARVGRLRRVYRGVYAIDRAGNRDRTPALFSFRVR